MKLFKKETKFEGTLKQENTRIKVLGSGCAKCMSLEEHVKEAIQELGMNEQVGHVSDFAQIAQYGVMSTPALVVDEKVVSFGKVLSKDEVIDLLKNIGM